MKTNAEPWRKAKNRKSQKIQKRIECRKMKTNAEQCRKAKIGKSSKIQKN